MREKRYLCMQCYSFHSEMRGVSEEEFLDGDNVCKELKCIRRGQPLEPAFYCEICDKMIPWEEHEAHRH